MAGMSPADLLLMPDDEIAVVQLLVRGGDLSLDAIVSALNRSEEEVNATLQRLRDKGFARPLMLKEGTVYRTYFARKRRGTGMESIWDQLEEKVDSGPSGSEDGEGADDFGESSR